MDHRRRRDRAGWSRRDLLRLVGLGAGGALAGAGLASSARASRPAGHGRSALGVAAHAGLGTVGGVPEGLDLLDLATGFDEGATSPYPGGRTLREWEIVAVDREIEIAPGLHFPAWTYQGRVPGPALRAREGDRVRIRFLNQGAHPHTIHFHGIHTHEMDGALPDQLVYPGERFTYEFDAEPYGLHLYHCHSFPLKRHIHKGLYGAFVVDPREDRWAEAEGLPGRLRWRRQEARELVLVMNAFDTNFDGENEVYAVNTAAFGYHHQPLRARVGEPLRAYVVNITEFDPINSFHLHANFFHVYRTGTRLVSSEYTDTVMMCQAERLVLEWSFPHPGLYMFHAHQSEFAELGWMGLFEVVP